jgi:hypothetical protein
MRIVHRRHRHQSGMALVVALLLLEPVLTGCFHYCYYALLQVHAGAAEDRYDSKASAAISEALERINLYAKEHGTVPSSLDVLTRTGEDVTWLTDRWGRPIVYSVSDEGRLTLTSFGRDGKPGGTEKDADMSSSLHTRFSDGTLWVGSPGWPAVAYVGSPLAETIRMQAEQAHTK